MPTSIPTTAEALRSLLRADLTTQWRNRRSVVLTLVVPVIILVSWKSLIDRMGGPFVLANSIGIGLIASGLMGYTNAIARDRDKGIFQRLRVAPLMPWTIVASRLLVQLLMIVLITTAVFIGGNYFDKITLNPAAYALTYLTAIFGGAIYLSLGQLIVGRITNPETVNSTTRLIYIAFVVVGTVGQFNFDGATAAQLHDILQWSPYGVVKSIIAGGMEPEKWDSHNSAALLVTALYTAVFSVLGIKWFKWNSK
jgi:ABC-2 type transport system permease protein